MSGPPELLRLNDFRLRLDRRLLFPPSELRLGISNESVNNKIKLILAETPDERMTKKIIKG